MATPANRVPVRIARGTKANLDTAMAAGDLKEGEICYAEDENGLYVVEGGTLTQAGADLSSASIDALTDVDTTTVAPTDGQVLIWSTADSEFQPGDALTDVDITTVAPTDGQVLVWSAADSEFQPGSVAGEIEWTLTANGTTDYIFAGPGFAGTETDPAVYVVRGQTYKFTNEMGAHPFQIQSTTGVGGTAYSDGVTNNAVSNGTLAWEVRMDAPATLYYQCTSHADMNGVINVLDAGADLSTTSIDALSDVDTTTVSPTDGQALVWDNAASQWEPGTVSASAARSTVTHTTASLADGASENATFSSTGKSGQFIKVTTDRAAWVTLYNTTAARTSDAGRLETVDPAAGSGVVLEVITTGSGTVQVTPTAGYYNDESTPLSELYAKIVNKSGSASTVQVDIDLLPLE